jgi:hypothetical protein
MNTRPGCLLLSGRWNWEGAASEKISYDQFEQLNVKKHSIHPDWNYTFSPGRKAS